jgi:hypothetical protein
VLPFARENLLVAVAVRIIPLLFCRAPSHTTTGATYRGNPENKPENPEQQSGNH